MKRVKILFVIATHGNEKIGPEVVEKLRARGLEDYFDVLIANPQALRKNKRFIECDLNRAYPGKKDSELYEERRAYDNLKIANNYKYIIDFHEAPEGKDDFIILSRNEVGSFPLELVPLKNVLFWPDPKGPMGDVLNNSIELEFGSKGVNRSRMIKKAVEITETFLFNLTQEVGQRKITKKIFWQVYGKLKKTSYRGEISNLKDFNLVSLSGEDFYPLLTGQYLDLGIICYKMKKIGDFLD